MMAANTHSDLEVVAPTTNDTHKYPYYHPDASPEPVPSAGTDTHKIAYESTAYGVPPPQSRICGLRKRTFWILVGVALVVVAAGVGGGIGGALASRKSSSSTSSTANDNVDPAQPSAHSASTSSDSTSPSSIPTSSSSPTPTTAPLTTTTLLGPTNSPQPTLLRDCPSSNNTLYSVTYGDTSFRFRKLCNDAYVNINGVAAPVQGVFRSLDDCIDKCAIYNRNNATRIRAGTDPLCNTVCWRNTFDGRNDWEGGHCFGFTTSNKTVDGETVFRTTGTGDICDSAALINQDF